MEALVAVGGGVDVTGAGYPVAAIVWVGVRGVAVNTAVAGNCVAVGVREGLGEKVKLGMLVELTAAVGVGV